MLYFDEENDLVVGQFEREGYAIIEGMIFPWVGPRLAGNSPVMVQPMALLLPIEKV